MKRVLQVAFAGALALMMGLAAATQAQAAGSLRPALPGEESLGTANFLVHYTRSGNDAVDGSDTNTNGSPDYVELVAAVLEESWRIEVNQFGWTAPPYDNGAGGDQRLDVYLQDIMGEGYAGYVETETYIGDNPNSPERERNASIGFMVLDNDYAEIAGDGSGETPEQLLRATVAHEFNHMIQGGYDDSDPHFWLYEATATWMEDEVYPDVNDSVWYLDAWFKSPDICLVSEGGNFGRDDDGRWYATWLLLRQISERYGHEAVRSIWSESRALSGFDAIDAALAPYGSSLLAESRDFGVSNLLRAYREGQLYPTVAIEGQAGQGDYRPLNGVQSLGTDYVQISASGVNAFSISGSGAPLTLRIVGVRGSEADVFEAVNGRVVVNLDGYSEVFALLHNDEWVVFEENCDFSDYLLNVSSTSEAPTAASAVYSAANFLSPESNPVAAGSVQGSGTEGGGTGAGTFTPPTGAPFVDDTESFSGDISGLDAGFVVLEPAYAPGGYEFDYAYILTQEELGDTAIYYSPDGGDTANFDYIDAYGNWLSVAQSPTTYSDVNAWLVGINYVNTPGTIQNIDGVDVLIEDLSDGDDIWFSASLVLDGLFIVVDGDHSEADVITLVQGLIAASQGTYGAAPAAAATQAPALEPPVLQPDQPELPGVAGADDWTQLVEDSAVMLGTAGILLCVGGLCLVGGAGLVIFGLLGTRRQRAVGERIQR